MEQKTRRLIVFLAGDLRNEKRLKQWIDELPNVDFFAADAGYYYAKRMNTPLTRVFGDFDSAQIPPEENLTVYPCEKDQTDSELALDLAIADGYNSVWMIAPFGGRIDHTIANIALLEKARKNHIDLKLYDGENLVFLLEEGMHTLRADLRYISFFPVGDRATVSLNGFKYPLDHKELQRMIPLAISNEPASESPQITIHHGTILCVCIEQEAK